MWRVRFVKILQKIIYLPAKDAKPMVDYASALSEVMKVEGANDHITSALELMERQEIERGWFGRGYNGVL